MVVGLYALLFVPSLDSDWVWDDVPAIRDNPLYHAPLLEGLLSTQQDHLDPNSRKLTTLRVEHDSYRPLLYLSYRLDISCFGASPRWMRVHNLLLGVVAIFLCYLLARRLLEDEGAALLATAIFAIHPVQTESLVYIAGRGDVLAGLFALASLYCLERWRARAPRKLLWPTLASTAFAASLLSKETYLGLPMVVLLFGWLGGQTRESLRGALLLGLVLCVYIPVRFAITGPTTSTALLPTIASLPGYWLQGLSIFLLPFDLGTERLADDSFFFAGWVALLALLAFTTKLALSAGEGKRALRVIAAGFALSLLCIGPSAIVVHNLGVLADRYLYLAVLAFAIVVAQGARYALACKPMLRALCLGLIALWGLVLLYVSHRQVRVWRDNFTLYSHALRMEPASSMAHYRLGYLYAANNHCPTALPLFQRALELNPANARAANNLGVCFMRLGDYQSALPVFQDAIRIKGSAQFRSWANLGASQIELGKPEDGCKSLRKALSINPNYGRASEQIARFCSHPVQ